MWEAGSLNISVMRLTMLATDEEDLPLPFWLEESDLLLEGGDLGVALDEDGGGPIPTAAASTYAADAAEAAVGHAPRALGGVGPGRCMMTNLICNCNTGTTDKCYDKC